MDLIRWYVNVVGGGGVGKNVYFRKNKMVVQVTMHEEVMEGFRVEFE